MHVSEAVRTKRAVRQFSSDPITDEQAMIILNAGRRSQSSKNTQPWHFIAIRDRQILDSLSKLGTYAGHLSGASLGVAILTPEPQERWSIMFDAGQAAAYMQLAGWEIGVASCLATIYEPEDARELLQFPDDFHLRVALSFGYPADPAVFDAPSRAGGRKSLDEILHLELW
jgi:nitroreductase